jgi:regulator of sirC expression with transglutaminase-like and TPR domain
MGMGALGRHLAREDATIEEAALLFARDEYPGLSVSERLGSLDTHARELADRIADEHDLVGKTAGLRHFVYQELGFRGNEASYYDPRNSYLNDVLTRRTGIPISLAVVLIALGRRVGLRVEGISFPGHFLVRVGGDDGPILDPFFSGREVPRDSLEALAKRALGPRATFDPAEHLAPATTRTMVIRMLSNLHAVYERRSDHARALVVCDRLVDAGASIEARRDRGRHAFALRAFDAAAEDLGAYLDERPDAEDARAIRAMLGTARHGAKGAVH